MKNNKENDRKCFKVSGWIYSLTMIVLILSLIVIFYITVIRYYLVGYSIKKGDLASTSMLLSPELAISIASVLL